MKKTILLFLLVSLPQFLFSQVKINQNKMPNLKNEVGIELGGNGLIYSAYYQREIYRKNNVQFNIKLGGCMWPRFINGNPPGTNQFGIYVVPNVLIYNRKHAWELGLGINNFTEISTDYFYSPYENNNTYWYFLTPQFAYRAYFNNNKFYFRAAAYTFLLIGAHESNGYTPDADPKVLPWAGISFGYTFGKK